MASQPRASADSGPPDSDVDVAGAESDGTDYDTDPDEATTSCAKRRKVSEKKSKYLGAFKYKTSFNKEWTKTWPFIAAVVGDPYKVRCNVCDKTVSIAHQGAADIRSHIQSQAHTKLAKVAATQPRLVFPSTSGLADKITRAEVKVAAVLVQGNVPFAFADQLSPLFKEIFPDSTIAAGYASKRTKTTCIINGALKGHFRSKLVEEMKAKPFSLATDGSNDTGLLKMNPLTVRIFTADGVSTQLLDMCMTRGSTSEDIFRKMDATLQKYGISWDNCISVGVDNTSVNLGKRKSVMTKVLEKNPAVFFNGCPCHIIHNTACKAGDAYVGATHFDVEDFCVDIYYWFDKSTKRKLQLEEFCTFCDTTYAQMIKYVSTRWLSLESAVTRILQKYAGLKSYFLSSDESNPRFTRLQKQFEDPMTEVHLLFYQAVLQHIVRVNKFMQLENPLIPIVHDVLHDHLKKLCCRFLDVKRVKEMGAQAIDYNNDLAKKTDEQLDIGCTTRTVLRKLIDDGHDMNKVRQFFSGVRIFYVEALKYARSHLPLDDPILKNAGFVNFVQRESAELSQVEYFIDRYSSVLPFNSDPTLMERLKEEFISYQLLEESDVPADVWKQAVIYVDDSAIPHLYSMDVVWAHLATRTNADGSSQFTLLSRVAHLVLTIPHSNAAEERVFSMVRKNKTPFRPNLDPDETLGSIITTKMALPQDTPAYKFDPPKELLVAAKKATREYNQAHSKH